VKIVVVVSPMLASAGAERGNLLGSVTRRLRMASAITSPVATVTGTATASTAARAITVRASWTGEVFEGRTCSP